MNIPYNKERCKQRLLKDYLKHGKLVVAFDFDNTIFDYHSLGDDYSDIISLLKQCTDLNFDLILFTVDTDSLKLHNKITYVSKILVTSNFTVNESKVMKGSIKPYYNILLDDRAGLEESCEILKFVIDYANNIH
jgi:hypothetical protein